MAAGAGATPAIAHTASPTVFSVRAGKPPPTIWAACPTIDRAAAEQKFVHRFDRAPGVATGVVPMPAGTSDLLCGNNDSGFYHIVARHYGMDAEERPDSYFDRLIRSVEDEDHAVFVGREEGRLLLTRFRGARFDPPLLFDFTEDELDAAVRAAGPSGKTLWPRSRSRRVASVWSSCISTRAS